MFVAIILRYVGSLVEKNILLQLIQFDLLFIAVWQCLARFLSLKFWTLFLSCFLQAFSAQISWNLFLVFTNRKYRKNKKSKWNFVHWPSCDEFISATDINWSSISFDFSCPAFSLKLSTASKLSLSFFFYDLKHVIWNHLRAYLISIKADINFGARGDLWSLISCSSISGLSRRSVRFYI